MSNGGHAYFLLRASAQGETARRLEPMLEGIAKSGIVESRQIDSLNTTAISLRVTLSGGKRQDNGSCSIRGWLTVPQAFLPLAGGFDVLDIGPDELPMSQDRVTDAALSASYVDLLCAAIDQLHPVAVLGYRAEGLPLLFNASFAYFADAGTARLLLESEFNFLRSEEWARVQRYGGAFGERGWLDASTMKARLSGRELVQVSAPELFENGLVEHTSHRIDGGVLLVRYPLCYSGYMDAIYEAT